MPNVPTAARSVEAAIARQVIPLGRGDVLSRCGRRDVVVEKRGTVHALREVRRSAAARPSVIVAWCLALCVLASCASASTAARNTADPAPSAPVAGDAEAPEDYTRLVAQHHAIYSALEDAVAHNTDATIAPFLDPALVRLPALERDLDYLAGRAWADRYPRLAATDVYVAHIRHVCSASPIALLAHHYIRYLGDLSGGQVIGRVLRRTYGFIDHRGTEFYYFPDLASPKAFKDRYRDRLDALPWDDARGSELIREVNAAYELNRAVFEALAPVVDDD